VPVHVAEKIMEERVREVGRSVHPANHYRLINMAELLKVNLINTHTITDNLVNNFLHEFLTKRAPHTIGDMVDCLLEIPEYHEAKKRGAGPSLFAGSPKHRVGKWLLEMTGGTNPSDKVYWYAHERRRARYRKRTPYECGNCRSHGVRLTRYEFVFGRTREKRCGDCAMQRAHSRE